MQIAIAEDNVMALKALINKLEPYSDVNICLIANNGKQLLNELEQEEVDLVLMDIEMPLMDGITATKQIRQKWPDLKIIMLTTFDDDDRIFNAILNGACGYLLKDESDGAIYKAMKDVLAGGAAMSPAIAFRTLHYVRKQHGDTPPVAEEDQLLSKREIEIITYVKDGLVYKQIADRLSLSELTVRKHIQNIFKKLEVNNKVSAINAVVEKKLI